MSQLIIIVHLSGIAVGPGALLQPAVTRNQ